MNKYYALFWLNADNFEGIIIDETGEKSHDQILREIGKEELSWDGSNAYFLSEKDPIIV